MADFNKISKQVADVAERAADVADAARGKGSRTGGGGARWLILPAVGAAVYAVVKSGSGAPGRAKDLVRQAKDRAPEMPELDLLGRVKEATGLADEDQDDGRSAEGTGGRSSRTLDQDQLERNRQERAKRRQRRRETISA